MHNRPLLPTEVPAIASKLTQMSTLKHLRTHAHDCTDRIQAAIIAKAVCAPLHLTRLELRGKGLVADAAGMLVQR